MAIAFPIEKLEQVLSEILLDEWEAQGHVMNGKVVKDIEYRIKQEVNALTLSGFLYPYGNIIAAGTKANKIPYSGRTGRGGTSLYIAALQNYAKVRMGITDEKKSLSIAFAIATEQKKHGMPTPGSFKYSQTGKRTDWIEETLKKNEDKIIEVISDMCYNLLSVNFDVLLTKWNHEFNN